MVNRRWLAAVSKSVQSRSAGPTAKARFGADRFCRFVRFDLERVKEALKAKGRGQTFVVSRKEGQRSATDGASGRRAQQANPDLLRRGRLSHKRQGGRNDRLRRIHPNHRLAGLHLPKAEVAVIRLIGGDWFPK